MRTANIIDHFASMPDPREDNRRHNLIDILFIVICATMCGAEKWEDVETFAKAKERRLGKYLDLPRGIPSHDTFVRVFAKLDPEAPNERYPGAADGKRVGVESRTDARRAAGG